MKKNRTMRVAALLLALTLITSCFVGGTFAKYATTAEAASGSATAAVWFSAINLSAGTTAATNAGVVANKMAPGTSGTITFVPTVTGTPEVDWKLTLTGTATAGAAASTAAEGDDDEGTTTTVAVPDTLTFTLNGGEAMSFAELQTALNSPTQIATGTAGEAAGTIPDVVIGWSWAFEGTDATDTAFAGQSITFDLTLTAEQVQGAASTP